MERFTFAKKVVSVRALSNSKTSMNYTGEENVLLSFGASKSGESGVTLVRKSPKNLSTKKSIVSSNNNPPSLVFSSERKIWKAFENSE